MIGVLLAVLLVTMCVVVRHSDDVEIHFRQPANIETEPFIQITQETDTVNWIDSIQ